MFAQPKMKAAPPTEIGFVFGEKPSEEHPTIPNNSFAHNGLRRIREI
jgi:hypothetical protein